ncbi:MAG: sigma-70 family RNA polymerase sigma factor [Verrucomicrobiales bacterium]
MNPAPPQRAADLASLDPDDATALFVERLTACQGQLFAYIYALTADAEMAKDALQEANRQLWRKAGDYDPDREFLPWAKAFAFNQVRAARTKRGRERLVFREDETIHAIADGFAAEAHQPESGGSDRAAALEVCLGKLGGDARAAIDRYYGRGEEVAAIAESLGRRANTVAVMLHRARIALAGCIRAALGDGETEPEPDPTL